MSDLRRQQRLERRRQRYRERRGAETPAEKERRLQNERARRRRRLLGESAEAKEARLERQRNAVNASERDWLLRQQMREQLGYSMTKRCTIRSSTV